MKPYIFNNYEKTLPIKVRGYYTAFPANSDEVLVNHEIESVDGIQLTIDLKGANSRKDVFERFYGKLGFPISDGSCSWDAFGDNLWFLKQTSAIFEQINPAVIHLKVLNINHLWTYSEPDYSILCEILLTSTDNSRFDDDFRLQVEVSN